MEKEIKAEIAADLKVVAVVVGAAELKDPKYKYCSFHFCISNRKEKSSPTKLLEPCKTKTATVSIFVEHCSELRLDSVLKQCEH